jgi:putative transcriptional regulator
MLGSQATNAMRRLTIAAALLWVQADASADVVTKRLRPGVFLYAAPDLQSPSFGESVVLLVQHGTEGSLGLIINRPTRVTVREAIEELAEMRGLRLALYFGGPVQPQAVLALVRSATPVDGGLRVLPGVYFSTEMKHLKAAARAPEAASRLRVYAGYAGWSPGQLAAELAAGAWIVGPADAGSVFSSDPDAVWPRVHDLLRRIEARRLDARGPAGRAP